MERAIELSARGYPAPNPHVGCVILGHKGSAVGEGWHDYAGGPHAEVMALRAAGEQARGGTACVSLEPCNHHGRTGPCSQALLRAGIRKVLIAVPDPNPQAAGGANFLEQAGVEIVRGVLQAAAERVNIRWLTAVRRKSAWVALKLAQTADGFVARLDGTSKWITTEESRAEARLLRAAMGSVMVGRRTVEADDPLLTVRDPAVRNEPHRWILDPNRRLGAGFQVWEGHPPATRIVRLPVEEPDELGLPERGDGTLDLSGLPAEIFRRGHTGVLIEGGAATIAQCFSQGIGDELHLFTGSGSFGSGVPALPEGWSAGWRLVEEKSISSDHYQLWRPE